MTLAPTLEPLRVIKAALTLGKLACADHSLELEDRWLSMLVALAGSERDALLILAHLATPARAEQLQRVGAVQLLRQIAFPDDVQLQALREACSPQGGLHPALQKHLKEVAAAALGRLMT